MNKFEYQISKLETNFNDRNINDRNIKPKFYSAFVLYFDHWGFDIVSDFEFRILVMTLKTLSFQIGDQYLVLSVMAKCENRGNNAQPV